MDNWSKKWTTKRCGWNCDAWFQCSFWCHWSQTAKKQTKLWFLVYSSLLDTELSLGVFFNSSFSESKDVLGGVPQGICLSPLLFSILTNNLPYVLEQASIVIYAYVWTMFSDASTSKELNEVLCNELKYVSNWAEDLECSQHKVWQALSLALEERLQGTPI